jgi:tetratricopeptide (TPR) repeat protein
MVCCSIAVAIALAIWLVPDLQATFQANLGALIQTRAELSAYHWPDWPLQDVRRRSPDVDLTPAIARYQAALASDPDKVSANRRLGQIELSLGQYQAACRHLETAYMAAPSQRANRQLVGECYALAGEIESATALWRTVDVSQSQLVLRRWWYEYLNEQQYAARVAQAAAALQK